MTEQDVPQQELEQIFSGRYEVTRRLGQGGQSLVFCARRRSDGALCTVKQVRPEAIPDLEQNLRILRRLDHPQLPRFCELGRGDGVLYIVQDYLPGVSLKQILESNRRMGVPARWPKVLGWMYSACEPLAYLHESQPPILHCDIKPANLILRQDGTVCLVDFDIARELTGQTVPIRAMSMAYASPEQKQFLPLDPRTDVYSLGVTAFQLLTHELPGESLFHRPLPRRVERLLSCCLAANSERRFQSVEELRKELDEILCCERSQTS
ncbi:MAG: serine/threonine protein kinase [Oscillospiraceae bacterium]|nr:serine/threonine protein kinase [Oscillospiraceae bacterium]